MNPKSCVIDADVVMKILDVLATKMCPKDQKAVKEGQALIMKKMVPKTK